MDDGRFLLLEDRSLWRIEPVGQVYSALWLLPQKIAVTRSENPSYPYRLVNADASNIVEARLIVQESAHWVRENIDSGKYLKLQDHSLWEVHSSSVANARLWHYLSGVVVTESENSSYPFLLINTDAGEVVEAKLLAAHDDEVEAQP